MLWASALAVVFLIAHLAFLPSTLEDIDSLNFALGIHDFDPAQHQPHPPGYPIFMALGQSRACGCSSDARALAPARRHLRRACRISVDEDLLRASSGSRATSRRRRMLPPRSPRCSCWRVRCSGSTRAGRSATSQGWPPTLAAQAALVTAFVRQRLNPERTPAGARQLWPDDRARRVPVGARDRHHASQAIWLTLPLLALVLLQRAGRGAAGALLGSAMTFTIGVLLWVVPLVIASGGLMAYRAALAAQGSDDFSGVDMLVPQSHASAARVRPARNVYLSLGIARRSDGSYSGWRVVGLVSLLLRAMRIVVLLAVLAGPYLLFHLMLQETVTTRYALPLIPPMAFLAVNGSRGCWWQGEASGIRDDDRWAPGGVVACADAAGRAGVRPGRQSHICCAGRAARSASHCEPGAAIAMHQTFARSVQTQNFGSTPCFERAPHARIAGAGRVLARRPHRSRLVSG